MEKQYASDIMKYEDLVLEKRGNVAILTLNRPEKLNALTPRMTKVELPAAIGEVANDDELRVLIITGAGRGFCSGGDVREMTTSTTEVAQQRKALIEPMGFHNILLRRLDKPTIAAINGVAAGGGISLALACDFRVASEDARFIPAFLNIGLTPDAGLTYFLPQVVGTAKALEILATGEIIDAGEAERIGLVNKVVPSGKLLANSLELANRLANAAPIAFALTKRALYQAMTSDMESQFYRESFNQKICLGTEDFKEGVKALAEKRKPVFKGK